MSTVTLTGNICIRGGRLQTISPTYYWFYESVLPITNDSNVPLQLRVYSPPGDSLLQDDTIVRVFGRIFAPPSSKILMDVTSIVPYPGDPASDNYEENIPNGTSVAIWGVGAVVNNAEYGADSKTRLFDLAVSDYV
ncbi:hypothetical protein JB92DRAFT_3206701 [Gautieria morchelliformis]|nr:hypothetical protein JB92DRAFT_2756963 [Gautieria morchelliformis]KAF8504086.1 hypothetical protein JB92DRAFT_3206701 [Gautieria morchelliformis]